MKFLFFENLRDQRSGFVMAVFHGVDERESYFAFFQVAEHRLAQRFGGSGEIEQVVDELERQARVASVVSERFFFGTFESAEDGAQTGAATEQAGSFVSGQPDGVVLGDVDAADFFELNEFAFDHFLREVDQNIEDAEIAFFERHLERLHVQPVTGKYAAMIAPAGIGGRAAAARVSAVDDVIMNQGRAVQQLNYCGEANRTEIALTSIAAAKKQQGGTQAFATAAEKIAGDFGYRLEGYGTLARQFLLDEN